MLSLCNDIANMDMSRLRLDSIAPATTPASQYLSWIANFDPMPKTWLSGLIIETVLTTIADNINEKDT